MQVVVDSEEDYDNDGVLMVPNWELEENWVMESRCSFHMCSRKEYFETLKLEESVIIHLGNGKACKVQGMGSVHLMMCDNLSSYSKIWGVFLNLGEIYYQYAYGWWVRVWN